MASSNGDEKLADSIFNHGLHGAVTFEAGVMGPTRLRLSTVSALSGF